MVLPTIIFPRIVAQPGFLSCNYGFFIQTEPNNCSEFKNNGELWDTMIKGNLDNYVEGMTDHDPKLFIDFVNGWDNGNVKIGSITFMVSIKTIMKVTSVALDSVSFPTKNERELQG